MENKFTGWKDVPLTFKGINQAYYVSNILKKKNIKPDYIYTSELNRAIKTSEIIKKELNLKNNIIKSWRLNERSYGSLEGECRNHIKNNFFSELNNFKNNIYVKPYIKQYSNYNSESIIETQNRFVPFWYNHIYPKIKYNNTILIISHKNQSIFESWGFITEEKPFKQLQLIPED